MNNDFLKEAYLSFFFLGKAPIAPGTFGTLGGVGVAFFAVSFFGADNGDLGRELWVLRPRDEIFKFRRPNYYES